MKKKNFIGMILIILAVVLGTSCKKKAEPVVQVPKPPPPVEKISEAEFLKNDVFDRARILKEGEEVTISVPDNVITDQNSFKVSFFPVVWTHEEAKPFVTQYMFPAVRTSWGYLYVNLKDYLDEEDGSTEIHILKESGVQGFVYKHIPTVLVEGSEGWFKVLEQGGDVMPLRSEWPDSLHE